LSAGRPGERARPSGRRERKKGRATKDAERRRLAKANARPERPAGGAREGFALLHVDGGARGSPGPAALGYVLDDESGARLEARAEAIGTGTAAEAEYRALLAGLLRARELGVRQVVARSDSRLLVGHVNGERNIKSARLLALQAQIEEACMRVGTVICEWIPAAANGEAHELVAAAMEQDAAPPEAAAAGRDGSGR
jgi:ribonuclease HI